MTQKPLNGSKTRPLTDHARAALASLLRGPVPRQEVNPGVANRLERGDGVNPYAEAYLDASPYANGKGKSIQFLRITDAGRKEAAK